VADHTSYLGMYTGCDGQGAIEGIKEESEQYNMSQEYQQTYN